MRARPVTTASCIDVFCLALRRRSRYRFVSLKPRGSMLDSAVWYSSKLPPSASRPMRSREEMRKQ
jgi:hypothetical protein